MPDELQDIDRDGEGEWEITMPKREFDHLFDKYNDLIASILKDQRRLLRDWWLRYITAFGSGGAIMAIFLPAPTTGAGIIAHAVMTAMLWSGLIIQIRRDRQDKREREG